MLNLTWNYKHFEELSVHELYAILRLRSEVFVVEQNCVFLEIDNKDQECFHLMGWNNDSLAAYARLVPQNVTFSYISIGRVVTSPAYRGKMAGKDLLAKSINCCEQIFGRQPIKIGAQLYLKRFYEQFGFRQTGDIYLEDNIEHIHMMRD
jgi:ElaA protein